MYCKGCVYAVLCVVLECFCVILLEYIHAVVMRKLPQIHEKGCDEMKETKKFSTIYGTFHCTKNH